MRIERELDVLQVTAHLDMLVDQAEHASTEGMGAHRRRSGRYATAEAGVVETMRVVQVDVKLNGLGNACVRERMVPVTKDVDARLERKQAKPKRWVPTTIGHVKSAADDGAVIVAPYQLAPVLDKLIPSLRRDVRIEPCFGEEVRSIRHCADRNPPPGHRDDLALIAIGLISLGCYVVPERPALDPTIE